jgi:S1-C subfamily serine protease
MGLAGAIPADLAREVAEAIMRDGRVRRSTIGLEVQPLFDSSNGSRGALVGGTIDGSPAEQAGFASGDILVKLAGTDISVRFAEEIPPFNQFVMRLPIGRPVEATVLRNGVEKTLRVTPVERESVEAQIRELPLLGITASNLTDWSRKELKRSSREGVRVRGVRPGGPADEAKPALRDDDVIVSIETRPTKSYEALATAVDELTRGKAERVPALVTFDRAGERLLTVVDLGRPGLEDPGLEARKAWIPVSVQVLTPELAGRLGVPGRTGVRVTRVIGGSTSSGLKVGDLITAIDGNALEASQPSDADLFATLIRQYKIGSKVELTIVRDATQTTVPVTLEASPRLPREMKKYEDPNFEFRVRDIAALDRLTERVPTDQAGVLVDAVREGGWAALGHLADGDVLLTIDGEAVTSVEAVQQKMARVAQAKPRSVVFKVRRGIRTFFVELETGWR